MPNIYFGIFVNLNNTSHKYTYQQASLERQLFLPGLLTQQLFLPRLQQQQSFLQKLFLIIIVINIYITINPIISFLFNSNTITKCVYLNSFCMHPKKCIHQSWSDSYPGISIVLLENRLARTCRIRCGISGSFHIPSIRSPYNL